MLVNRLSEKGWFSVLGDFCGVSTPVTANIKWPVPLSLNTGLGQWAWGALAANPRWLQHTTAPGQPPHRQGRSSPGPPSPGRQPCARHPPSCLSQGRTRCCQWSVSIPTGPHTWWGGWQTVSDLYQMIKINPNNDSASTEFTELFLCASTDPDAAA